MATMAGAMQMDHINVNRTALAMPTGPGVVKMEANSTYIKPEIPVSAATEEAIDDEFVHFFSSRAFIQPLSILLPLAKLHKINGLLLPIPLPVCIMNLGLHTR